MYNLIKVVWGKVTYATLLERGWLFFMTAYPMVIILVNALILLQEDADQNFSDAFLYFVSIMILAVVFPIVGYILSSILNVALLYLVLQFLSLDSAIDYDADAEWYFAAILTAMLCLCLICILGSSYALYKKWRGWRADQHAKAAG